MRDAMPRDEFPEDLALRALLYASGELEGEEASAFEARLATDQEARDALAQAVELTLTASGEPKGPSAGWREETRSRLLQRASLWQRLAGPRVYRGHPAVWSVLGAVAAALVLSLMPAPPTTSTHVQVMPFGGADRVHVLEQKAERLARELDAVNAELEKAKQNGTGL